MFGRKEHTEEGATSEVAENKDSSGEVPGLSPAPRQEAAPAPMPAAPTQFRPEIPRRVTEIPGAPRASSALDTDDTKKLIVGREIRLNGEITACEKLVVEGRVEANLTDSRIIDIATTGYFKGTAEVDEAIISGEFHGTLTVRGRLFVRATGKVSGDIRYGELEIERGGRLSGDVDQNGSASREVDSEESAVAAEGD
jgi:cytoskeletal protein CcmA (bactofilin family)